MAEILGLGLSHYPLVSAPDRDMACILSWTLDDPGIPDSAKDPANWPERMREEWGDDLGERAAAGHRAAMVAGFDRVRRALDEFEPDVVIIWGDDQYENFREDLVPPYAILAYDDMTVRPWGHAQKSSAMLDRPNIWDEGEDHEFTLRGRADIARHLATMLLENGVDVSYAYKPRHHDSLSHAFLNAILYLDYHRQGFDYPVIPFALNCYGRRVICCKGFLTRRDDEIVLDPPSPPPRRFMEIGAATVRVLRDSPWRVALVSSSSWSHAFLCEANNRLWPDGDSDRRLYRALQDGDYDTWQATTLQQLEDAGQQEVLNWCALLGAMRELGAELEWSNLVETDAFNSNKAFAVYRPA